MTFAFVDFFLLTMPSDSGSGGFQAYAHLLDARILRALADNKFGTPTPVQRESLQYSLGGAARDILARARTGSGKTLAYGLPILQKIVATKQGIPRSSAEYSATREFGLRTCVLNEELPVNSRFHIVEEFNKGKYDYIIATDANAAPESKKTTSSQRGKEFNVSRGIDFVAVACVINFDLPTSTRAYTHRIGRTARAGNTGTALSFVVPRREFGKKKALCCPTCKHDEQMWEQIVEDQKSSGMQIHPWTYDRTQVEAFRYRMEDALRSVTKAAIKEARIQEIKQEILNSEALKAHFEENPRDLEYLRHDRALHPARVQAHMKHIPSYLRPRIASLPGTAQSHVGYVPKNRPKVPQRGKKNTPRGRSKKKSDPLKSFT